MTKGHCPWGSPGSSVLGVSQAPRALSWWPNHGVQLAAEGVSPPWWLLALEKGHDGVGDTLWGPAMSLARLLPAGCLPPPQKKKNPDMGDMQCVPMLQGALEMYGAEPLTRLPASVSPAQLRAAPPARRQVWEGC